jgi:hypothetical protein
VSAAYISEEEARRQAKELMAPSEPPAPVKKTIRYRERVAARLGKGGKPRDAIVTIDKAQTLRIRPFRGRKTYEVSMEQAVAWLMQKLIVPDGLGKRRRRL